MSSAIQKTALCGIVIYFIFLNFLYATDSGWNQSINSIPFYYYNMTASNVLRCGKLCERQKNCAAVTFDGPTRTCYMHEKTAKIEPGMIQTGSSGRYQFKNFTDNLLASTPKCDDAQIAVPSLNQKDGQCVDMIGARLGYVYDSTYDIYYKTTSKTQRSNIQQRAICEAEGGQLFTIQDRAMFDWLVEKTAPACPDKCAFAIDGTDEGHEGTWTTFSNQPLPWVTWNPRDPNNKGGIEHCLHLSNMWSSSIGFSDVSCNLEITFYACQINYN